MDSDILKAIERATEEADRFDDLQIPYEEYVVRFFQDYVYRLADILEVDVNFFILSVKEKSKLEEWRSAIKTLYGEVGKLTYSFTPTGIGDVVKIRSELANVEIDLTDYESW